MSPLKRERGLVVKVPHTTNGIDRERFAESRKIRKELWERRPDTVEFTVRRRIRKEILNEGLAPVEKTKPIVVLPIFDDDIQVAVWIQTLRYNPSFVEKTNAANELGRFLDKVTDPDVFRDVAIHATDRRSIIGGVHTARVSTKALIEIVISARNEIAIKEAIDILSCRVEQIRDVEILKLVYYETTSDGTKSEVADKIGELLDRVTRDWIALRVVATFATDETKKIQAIEYLAKNIVEVDDIKACKLVAVYSDNPGARVIAVAKLRGFELALATVAKYSAFEDARLCAVALLKNNVTELVDVAKRGQHSDARIAAVNILGRNVDVLKDIHVNSDHQDTRTAAIKKLEDVIDTLDDVDALKCIIRHEIAESDTLNPVIEDAADQLAKMQGIVDSDAMMYVAIWAREIEKRRAAITALATDHRRLDVVMMYTAYDDSRLAAVALRNPAQQKVVRMA